ncbi:MAG TPA: hypothetical protein VGU69_14525 [Rhizomicrobium sp.]|nr:hypothetical protein [Rhizomicrobium sp.]
MQSNDTAEIPYIQPPKPARFAFSVWIAVSILSMLIAAATIDPAMVGISNFGWMITSLTVGSGR